MRNREHKLWSISRRMAKSSRQLIELLNEDGFNYLPSPINGSDYFIERLGRVLDEFDSYLMNVPSDDARQKYTSVVVGDNVMFCRDGRALEVDEVVDALNGRA